VTARDRDDRSRVRIPADVERPDKLLAGLTARQLAILAVTAVALWAGYAATRQPSANIAATAPTGTATTPNTTGGTRWRVAAYPAHRATAVTARMASWRAVSPARSLSGRSTSAGIRTRDLLLRG
jgi:hypothetical protein